MRSVHLRADNLNDAGWSLSESEPSIIADKGSLSPTCIAATEWFHRSRRLVGKSDSGTISETGRLGEIIALA
jgi:hypothetical protein